MKRNLLSMLLVGQLACATQINAQNIAINATGNLPDTSAMLDVSSSNKGFLTPRMTTTEQNAIPLPSNGLLIFNTTENAFQVNTGTAAVPVWSKLATGSAPGSGWSLTGNAGISQPAVPSPYGTALGGSENYLGTTDAQDLVFATNNIERMRLMKTSGYIGIGTAAPTKPIDLVKNLSNEGLMKLQNTNANGYSSIDVWSASQMIGNIGFSNSGASYPNAFYFATNTTNSMVFATSNTERLRVDGSTGNIGLNVASPTAVLHLEAGTAAAGSAPLKFTAGTNLTTAENGTVEYDGSNYYATAGGVRYTLAKTLTTTASLNFVSTAAGSSSDLTISLTGAVVGDAVALGLSNAPVGSYVAFVSAANVVTVRFTNYTTGALNPNPDTFRVTVIRN